MTKILMFIVFVFTINTMSSQVIYEPFESSKLGTTREIKIQLPRNYNPEDKMKYPLIVVLDGDYLFEPVVGNADFQSYWGDMPKCIVVGVNQNDSRYLDFNYDEELFFPSQEGAKFFEFLGMELIPYIEGKYNVSNFRVGIGHDLSANFLNFYLFKDNPVFNAYVLLSPDLSPEMANRVTEKLTMIPQETFYYVATGENDIKGLKQKITSLDTQLKPIENTKLHYRFDDFTGVDHYGLASLGIPTALNDIFSMYRPITLKEYNDKVLTYEEGPYAYLVKKYDDIKYFFGFDKKLLENDIKAIATAAIKLNNMDALKDLSKMTRKEYSNSMISAYYQGLYYEKDGNIKKALQYYQSGLLLEESEFINKDILLDKIYDLKG